MLALGAAELSARLPLEPAAAQPELPEARLADAVPQRLLESQFWVQLEWAAVLLEASASVRQVRPASLLALEVQRASEAQPVRAEQRAASCQEWLSARLQAWRYATSRSWF